MLKYSRVIVRFQRCTRRHDDFSTELRLEVTIGLVGFEPTASWSRTRRSTKLSHSPRIIHYRPGAPVTSRSLMQIARTELGLRVALVLFYSGSRRSLHVHPF